MSRVGAQALRNARQPEPTLEHRRLVADAYAKASSGWYTGDMETLVRYGYAAEIPTRTNPDELALSIRFTRDRMHHSVGWWRNAEYEFCFHLSLSARPAAAVRAAYAGIQVPGGVPFEELPKPEEDYWGRLFFHDHADKVWHEPGGTDPRLTPEEARRHRHISHLRLFLDPETFEPFLPAGEVYDLTRWLPFTPDKVDR